MTWRVPTYLLNLFLSSFSEVFTRTGSSWEKLIKLFTMGWCIKHFIILFWLPFCDEIEAFARPLAESFSFFWLFDYSNFYICDFSSLYGVAIELNPDLFEAALCFALFLSRDYFSRFIDINIVVVINVCVLLIFVTGAFIIKSI